MSPSWPIPGRAARPACASSSPGATAPPSCSRGPSVSTPTAGPSAPVRGQCSPLPAVPSALGDALVEATATAAHTATAPPWGRVVAVAAAKGGAGATAIALALARLVDGLLVDLSGARAEPRGAARLPGRPVAGRPGPRRRRSCSRRRDGRGRASVRPAARPGPRGARDRRGAPERLCRRARARAARRRRRPSSTRARPRSRLRARLRSPRIARSWSSLPTPTPPPPAASS